VGGEEKKYGDCETGREKEKESDGGETGTLRKPICSFIRGRLN